MVLSSVLSHLQPLARLRKTDSLIPNSAPEPPKHCSTLKTAWSSPYPVPYPVPTLPSSLNDPGNPHSTLCCAKQASQSGVGEFPNEKGWSQVPVAPSSSSPRPDSRVSGAGPGVEPPRTLCQSRKAQQLRSIRVITTYTLCYFLVEQAQAPVQWDSGVPACPRDGAHSPPPPSLLSSDTQ